MVRIVAQRVSRASARVDGEVIGSIGKGLALLVGIRLDDDGPAVDRVVDKIAGLRIFDDEEGKMNLSAGQVGAEMLVVSQFTLYADVRKGRRPSFTAAARPDLGRKLYERFVERLAGHGFRVAQGRFGAHMVVALENDGPVTIVVDHEDV